MTRFREWFRRLASRWTRRPRYAQATISLKANVRLAVYDGRDLEASVPSWDALTPAEKLEVMDSRDPLRVAYEQNTTTVDWFEYIVDDLDPNQAVDVEVTHLALGDDGTEPASGNRSLNNEVYRTQIASSTDAGATLETRTLLDTSEANGETIREVGLTTAGTGGLLLNHSLIQEEPKNDRKAFTIDVDLTAGPA